MPKRVLGFVILPECQQLRMLSLWAGTSLSARIYSEAKGPFIQHVLAGLGEMVDR